MHIERESLILDLEFSEKSDAEFIKRVFKHYMKFKPEIVKIAGKLRDSWRREEQRENNSYMG